MKPAKQWANDICFARLTPEEKALVIEQIQADVFNHCAQVARDMNDGHDWPISRFLHVEGLRLTKPIPDHCWFTAT